MKRRLLLLLIVLTATASMVGAQNPCGNGIPCRPPAWDIPDFPELVSPTALSGDGAPNTVPTNTPTLTPTPTPLLTSTAIPTFTPFIDAGSIEGQLETLGAVMSGTDIPILVSGTPVTVETQVASIGSNANTFIGYFRTIQNSNFLGPFAPLLTMLGGGLVVVLVVKATTYILPLGAAVFGIIRKVVNTILDFIPL